MLATCQSSWGLTHPSCLMFPEFPQISQLLSTLASPRFSTSVGMHPQLQVFPILLITLLLTCLDHAQFLTKFQKPAHRVDDQLSVGVLNVKFEKARADHVCIK